MNVVGLALDELYRIYTIINHDKFNDELPEPVITIQKTKGNVLGHFTPSKTWKNKNDIESEDVSYHEINIDPRWFCNRSAVEVVETLLHEMCHYCNEMAEIKDCNGNNHNKKFKAMAESVGLIVEKGKGVGYGYTYLSDELEKYIKEMIKPNEKAFEYFRDCNSVNDGGKKPKAKTTFKYTCPDCGQVAKGKKDIVLKCGLCDVVMEIEDIEEEPDIETDSDIDK